MTPNASSLSPITACLAASLLAVVGAWVPARASAALVRRQADETPAARANRCG